jgi:competence protein ComFB
MEIRNLMEDKVLTTLLEICENDETTGKHLYCTSEQCRLDAACYVLNRIPQRYVTSGRGFAYLEADFQDNTQLQVDVVTLCHEGLRRVTNIQRSFYSEEQEISTEPLEGFFYNFPLIKGRVLNGITFEPAIDLEISIVCDCQPISMIDSRWPNPYSVVGNTPGTYLFWPRPLTCDKEGEEKTFEMALHIQSEAYEDFHHYFTLTLRSSAVLAKSALSPKRDFQIQDLFIIPKGIVDEMQ